MRFTVAQHKEHLGRMSRRQVALNLGAQEALDRALVAREQMRFLERQIAEAERRGLRSFDDETLLFGRRRK